MAAAIPWVKFADPEESDSFAANCFPVRGLLQTTEDGMNISFSDLCFNFNVKFSYTTMSLPLHALVNTVGLVAEKRDTHSTNVLYRQP